MYMHKMKNKNVHQFQSKNECEKKSNKFGKKDSIFLV